MAGRPVKRRTTKSYARDIETLSRLRMSILLNEGGDTAISAVGNIDALTRDLLKLIPVTVLKSA